LDYLIPVNDILDLIMRNILGREVINLSVHFIGGSLVQVELLNVQLGFGDTRFFAEFCEVHDESRQSNKSQNKQYEQPPVLGEEIPGRRNGVYKN
jgi:hypothetical protein